MTRTALLSFILPLIACSHADVPTEEVLVRSVVHAPSEPVVPDYEVSQSLVAPMRVVLDEPVPSDTPVETPAPNVEVATTVPSASFTIRRGETLAHFARWAEMPVEDVADQSALSLDGHYPVGTRVSLVLSPEERTVVTARREAHHQLRARNYLDSRNSSVTRFHTVRTGESAWTIAKHDLAMPVWMLESLNPSVNLETLRPGQELLVPVFDDIVVEADPVVESLPAREPDIAAE